jgi:hypothetical protein
VIDPSLAVSAARIFISLGSGALTKGVIMMPLVSPGNDEKMAILVHQQQQ